jgi:hypothetical protein
MLRYFTTRNATRPFKTGGLAFEFEPYEQIGGGSWLGVLAVDDPAASILTEADFPQVSEIDADAYEAIKKKIQEAQQLLRNNPGARPAPAPDGNCQTCGRHGYQVVR